MRPLAELLDEGDPALPLLRRWIDDPSGNGGAMLAPDDPLRSETLLSLQVTTRSMLGAVAYETGGVSVADGLLRLLGSGAERSLRRTADTAGCPLDGKAPDVLVVGDDVLGGVFALNGGRFGPNRAGEVYHLAADKTTWAALEIGFSDFVSWCLTGDLEQLYEPISKLTEYQKRPRPFFDKTFSFYPFLWSHEAKQKPPDVRVISAEENLRMRLNLHGFSLS